MLALFLLLFVAVLLQATNMDTSSEKHILLVLHTTYSLHSLKGDTVNHNSRTNASSTTIF
jgi:hypothetical protein